MLAAAHTRHQRVGDAVACCVLAVAREFTGVLHLLRQLLVKLLQLRQVFGVVLLLQLHLAQELLCLRSFLLQVQLPPVYLAFQVQFRVIRMLNLCATGVYFLVQISGQGRMLLQLAALCSSLLQQEVLVLVEVQHLAQYLGRVGVRIPAREVLLGDLVAFGGEARLAPGSRHCGSLVRALRQAVALRMFYPRGHSKGIRRRQSLPQHNGLRRARHF